MLSEEYLVATWRDLPLVQQQVIHFLEMLQLQQQHDQMVEQELPTIEIHSQFDSYNIARDLMQLLETRCSSFLNLKGETQYF
jgi:hypothetical protein